MQKKKNDTVNRAIERMLGFEKHRIIMDLVHKVDVSSRSNFDFQTYFNGSIVAEYVTETHKKWLATPGRNGQAHNDTNMRRFEIKDNKYKNAWDLIK